MGTHGRFADVGERISLGHRYKHMAERASGAVADEDLAETLSNVASEGLRDRDRVDDEGAVSRWYGCGWEGFGGVCSEHGVRKIHRLSCRDRTCPICSYDDTKENGHVSQATLEMIGATGGRSIEHTTPEVDWKLYSHPDTPKRLKADMWAAFKNAAHQHIRWLAWDAAVRLGLVDDDTPEGLNPWLRKTFPVEVAGIESGHYWSSEDPLAGPRAHLHNYIPDVVIINGTQPVRLPLKLHKAGSVGRQRRRAWAELYRLHVDRVLRGRVRKRRHKPRKGSLGSPDKCGISKQLFRERESILRTKPLVWYMGKWYNRTKVKDRVQYQGRTPNVDLASVMKRFTVSKIKAAGRWALAVIDRKHAPVKKRLGWWGFLAPNSKLRKVVVGKTIVEIRTELREEADHAKNHCDVCDAELERDHVRVCTHGLLEELRGAQEEHPRPKVPPDPGKVRKPYLPKLPPMTPTDYREGRASGGDGRNPDP